MSELTARELLKQRCFEIYQKRNFTMLWEEVIEKQITLNTDLERKVALLEAFVAAEDAFNDNAQSEDWDEDDALYHQMLDARAALDWLPR